MSALDGLPTCLTLRPSAIVPAVRGALGFDHPGVIEVARAVRDHRELLPEEIVDQLVECIRAWLVGPGCDASAGDRAPWVEVRRVLMRPTLVEAANARRQAWLARDEPDRRAGAR